MKPKHPGIKLKLTGSDGNAFAILGKANQALKKAGVSKKDRDEFFAQATSGDYDHLLGTCMKWMDVR